MEFDFFSNSDWSKNFVGKKNFFLADFDNTTKVNRIFLASVFIGLSNRTSKKSNKWISFFSNSDWSKNFEEKKKFFLPNFDNTTKVNRIFLVSVFIGLSIPMSKKSNNGIRFFLKFWLVEKFCEKKNFFSRISTIQQRSIEFF